MWITLSRDGGPVIEIVRTTAERLGGRRVKRGTTPAYPVIN